ncbi:MAG: hypothetical protein QNJ69_10080 [Gammaproteobacteria bacterium]|nr:hypothetical protein [Gammaproteobacteria bacterium]
MRLNPWILAVLIALLSQTVSAQDNRQLVPMPDMMKNHMLANMRDHLLALEEITRYLANQQYDEAADVAENRLGMSSLESHGASHMARVMPKQMAATGTEMHRAASRFALAARDAELEGGLNKAFAALSDVMTQCSACHSAYRVH